jgi:hypothetical protein
MASGGKKKTTMAKLNRESKLREKRMDKQARKDARRQAAADGIPSHELNGATDDAAPSAGEHRLGAATTELADR